MSEAQTIAKVAISVLNSLGRPASIEEIFDQIKVNDLYRFNTPTPEHVLRTTIRRHTRNVERTDSLEPIYFELVGDDLYKLLPAEGRKVTPQPSTGIRRVHRAPDKEPIIKLLMSDQVGAFKEIWRLLLFSAQVGMQNRRREPLGSIDAGKGIDQTTFGNCPSWPGLSYLMALVENDSPECLSGSAQSEELRLNTFQEYANGGLSILKEYFSDRPVNLDAVLAFIDSQKQTGIAAADLDLSI